MTSSPSDWLSEIGLAQFDYSAVANIQSYAEEFARDRGVEFFRAFLELGAADFALAPLYPRPLPAGQRTILDKLQQPPPSFPVSVSDIHVAYAIFKTNCGPFSEHPQKSPSELAFWDVFTFAGDMSKLELTGLTNVNNLADPANMQTLVDNLGKQYEEAGLGSPIVESGLMAAQGLVWFAKLAVLRGEDYTSAQGMSFADRFLRRPEIA